MKKHMVPVIAAVILIAASGLAGATHLSAGYMSRDGDINFTLGGRYDLGRGSSVEGAYTVLPGGYDVAASYKMALYRSSIVAGPADCSAITCIRVRRSGPGSSLRNRA